MPHPFQITATHNQTGVIEAISGQFSDDDWQQLTAYFSAYERLSKCRLTTSREELNFSFKYDVGEPVKHSATLPPDDDIDAFLLRMRPFVLEREPTSFFRIRNILASYFTLPTVRRHLDALKDRYAGKFIEFRIEVGQASLTAPQALDKWLNAFDYHQDTEKRAELEAMFAIFPEQSARALFLYAMLERAAAVEKVARLIEGVMKRDGEPHLAQS